MEIPQHLAIIMDGNGRWAEKRQWPRVKGHQAGVLAVRRVVELCLSVEIQVLSLFAFSSENWKRSAQEVSFLMGLFLEQLYVNGDELHEKGIRVQCIGDRQGLGAELITAIEQVEQLTQHNQRLVLVIAINYGGRWDIIDAVRRLVSAAVDNQITLTEIDESLFNKMTAVGNLPGPDLLIRTSGEQRLSNFYLWQLAYTELYYTETLWPDFDEQTLTAALQWYAQRQRRFGATKALMCV